MIRLRWINSLHHQGITYMYAILDTRGNSFNKMHITVLNPIERILPIISLKRNLPILAKCMLPGLCSLYSIGVA
jgi:hypothetical protein